VEKKHPFSADLMEKWAKDIWKGALELCVTHQVYLLAIGVFRGHLSEELKIKLKMKNCDSIVFPGSMTCQLQLLDVSDNTPFNGYLWEEYAAWFLSDNLPLAPSGKIKRASTSQLAEWISAAWKKIAESTEVESFKKFCITNAFDRTENILWDYSDLDCSDLKDDRIICTI
jgi:hypothetical protein